LELAQQLLALAGRSEDPGQVLLAHYGLASALLFLGEDALALTHAERGIELYDPEQHHVLTFLIVGHDPGAQCLETAAHALWRLGYPDQARQRIREALVLTQALAHPFSLALAYQFDGLLQSWCRDWQIARERAEAALDISNEQDSPVIGAHPNCVRGLGLAKQGQAKEGIALLRRGIAVSQAAGMQSAMSLFYAWLAEVYIETGRMQEGLSTLDKALAFVAESDEGFWGEEIHRLKGELLRAQGKQTEAEASFHKAIAEARGRSARSLELRATMSLARLWQKQGKREEARQMLAEIYGWFTEGFDTGDLQEAKALLDELSQVENS
jgi:predicted ATPase